MLGEDTEDVVGAVHVKHAIAVPRADRGSTTVGDVMVDAPLVPESMKLEPLLSLLRGESFQIAAVIDEYGGTAGIVTLEDVVEEIVGDIVDEHDRRDPRARELDDGTWTLSGLLRPDEVQHVAGVRLPEDDDYDTLAGLVLARLGRMPRAGDDVVVDLPVEVDDDGRPGPRQVADLTVLRLSGRRIDRVSLAVREKHDEDDRPTQPTRPTRPAADEEERDG